MAPTVPPRTKEKNATAAPGSRYSTIRSSIRAMKREPRPPSGSASSTPSGVAIVRRSSYSTVHGPRALGERRHHARPGGRLTPETFTAERAEAWAALDAALRRAGDRPERLGGDG